MNLGAICPKCGQPADTIEKVRGWMWNRCEHCGWDSEEITDDDAVKTEPQISRDDLNAVVRLILKRYVGLNRLYDIVKYALSQRGDDVCWRDIYNQEVADIVGEKFDPQLPPKDVFVNRNCDHFYDCLATGAEYKTPES